MHKHKVSGKFPENAHIVQADAVSSCTKDITNAAAALVAASAVAKK
jgi:hypothetical protein